MITDSNIIETISLHHLFSSLTANEMQQLLGSATQTALPALDNLFHQGDSANRFYLVLEGHYTVLVLVVRKRWWKCCVRVIPLPKH